MGHGARSTENAHAAASLTQRRPHPMDIERIDRLPRTHNKHHAAPSLPTPYGGPAQLWSHGRVPAWRTASELASRAVRSSTSAVREPRAAARSPRPRPERR
jgi:hypothetical protein